MGNRDLKTWEYDYNEDMEEDHKSWCEDYDGDIEEDMEEDLKPWWEDYDGDIEEERRKIIERVNEIEDPDEREFQYEELLNALEYNEYFAYNPHFKCEESLINLRRYSEGCEDEDIDEFIDRILDCTNMSPTYEPNIKNILIVNAYKKFTFLNTTKSLGMHKVIEKGIIKMRREYEDQWGEDDEKNFKIAYVK